jgi:hypothetical protein
MPRGEKQAAKDDLSEFKVRVETSGGLVKSYRRDQLVLSWSAAHPNQCYVRGPEGLYASVILNQPTSPRIGIHEHLEDCDIELERIDANTLKLHVMDFESNFAESYVITPKSIAPVSADEYSGILAQWKAARKWADSVTDSVYDLNESLEDDQHTTE